MRTAIRIVVAAIATLAIAVAHARETPKAEPTRNFQIAAQPLSQALLEFSRQADVIVTAPSELVRSKRAPEIRGELTPSVALARLLRGSGLACFLHRFRRDHDRCSASLRASANACVRTCGQQCDLIRRSSDALIEEVLVTAQKRTENVQDVPSSVSVFDSRRVRQLHATTILDYAAYIPGLNVSSGGGPGQTMITLRGIAPVGPGAVVGYYVDDTPLGSSSNYGGAREFGLDLMPYDVERIEVLRGPQGTLYGAGAMGGLLKYVLRRPSVTDFEAWAGAETFGISSAADFGWGVRAGANVPLAAERVGLWGSYFEQQTPGYVDNAHTGAQDENDVSQRGGRLALLWQINDALSLAARRSVAADRITRRCRGVAHADRRGSADRRCKPRSADELSSAAAAVRAGHRSLLGDARVGSGLGEPAFRQQLLARAYASCAGCIVHLRRDHCGLFAFPHRAGPSQAHAGIPPRLAGRRQCRMAGWRFLYEGRRPAGARRVRNRYRWTADRAVAAALPVRRIPVAV